MLAACSSFVAIVGVWSRTRDVAISSIVRVSGCCYRCAVLTALGYTHHCPLRCTSYAQQQVVRFDAKPPTRLVLRPHAPRTNRVQHVGSGDLLLLVHSSSPQLLGLFVYIIYTAYAEMDWRVVAQIKKDGSARGLAAGKTFKRGDFILRVASGELKVLHPEEFEEQFEADPGRVASADGFQAYRATGKLWAHELSEEEAAACFPTGKFISAGDAGFGQRQGMCW